MQVLGASGDGLRDFGAMDYRVIRLSGSLGACGQAFRAPDDMHGLPRVLEAM